MKICLKKDKSSSGTDIKKYEVKNMEERKERVGLCIKCMDRFFEHINLICGDCKDCEEKFKELKAYRERVREVATEGLTYCCC